MASASAKAAAAATIHLVAGSRAPARITHQAASATRNRDMRAMPEATAGEKRATATSAPRKASQPTVIWA